MANRCTTIEEALERIYNIIDSAENKDNPVQYVLDGFKEVAEVVPLDLYPEIIKFIKEAKEDGSFAVIDQINEESCFTENADFDRIRADIEEKARNLSQYEETVVRKSQVKQQVLKRLFGENLYTAQYYLRSAKNGFGLVQCSSDTGIPGLIDTFLANRKNQKLVRNQDIAENVRNTKQALLDKVLEFMRNQKERNKDYIDREVFSEKNTRLFDRNGEYLNTLDPETDLYNVIMSWFNPKNIAMSNSLDTKYTLFKIENNPEAREYIDAYTAWTLLTNFDTTLILTLGNSVLITEPSNFNKISNVSYKTNIDKATNMWSFGFGDDVEDVGDLISDITKLLVESSKRYSWKVNVPNQDSYLSFKDFNYIIGKVKNLAFTLHGKSDIDLDYYINGKDIITNENVYNLSGTTRGVYENFKEFNKSIGKENEPVTLGQLIAFASENPMRSLHAIFDILCNTDILTNRIKSFTDTDKNLLWSCYKEIFGQCGENSRSLFDLHHNTEGDTIFSIIAQLADSMFQEDIIQYYEDDNKALYAQFMRDYTINQIRNELAQQIQQSSSATLSKGAKEFTDAYNVKIEFTNKGQLTTTDKQAWEVGTEKETVPVQAKLIAEIKIPVKITRNGKKIEAGEIIATATNIKFETKNGITEEEIWNSGDFRELIKDATGINFGADPDLAQAYQQMFQGASEINYTALLDDITRIVGRSVFNNYFNTKLVPQILHEFSLTWNQPNINNIAYSQFMNVESIPRVDPKTGLIPSIPSADKNLVLDKLSQAKAISNNIYTSAQVKTGEGTALAAYCLSRLRNSYQYQLVTQNRAAWSASRDMTFVDNKNGLFNKVFTSREVKLSATVKPSTKMSSVELWSLNFYNDWVSAFVKKTRTNSPNGDGACCFIPSVNSDKGQYDKLGCNLNALSHIKDIKGNPIAYRNLTSDQIVDEICMEFGPFYRNVINNITKEWDRVLSVILSNESLETDASGNKTAQTKIYEDAIADINQISNPVVKWREQLKFIDKYFSGKKEKTLDGLHRITTKYNMTHTRNPIQLAEQIHYTKGDDGLSVNKVLVAQWARFGGAATEEDLKQAKFTTQSYYRESLDQAKITQLYYRESLDQDLLNLLKKTVSAEDLSKETISAATLSKELFDKIPDDNPLKEEVRAARRASVQSNAKGFFRMRDFESVIKLLKNGCKIYLYGAKAREQAETEFLRNFGKTSKDKKSPWVTDSGMMAFVRVTGEDGREYPTNNFNDLIEAQNSGRNWEVHPLISKLNRMHYLTTQQYTCCVGGSVYAYKGKSGSNVLEEEANRWLASNKRNVCYTATIHKFLNKLLNGSPTTYNYAIFDDIDAALYNVMGELNMHTPLDGGMLVDSFLPDLENASLGGEAAGTDKKHFGTFYLEKYGAGGITKTAGFAATNERMRNSEAWRIVQYNMSHRKWVKEFGNADGDIPETELDITKDYDGNDINWPDKKIFYYRELKDGTIKFYRLSSIEKTNNINEYKIYEVPVDESGGDIGQPELREITVIDNNWDLFTKVFGGYRSLGREVSSTGVENPNSRLTYSERSRKLMVEAINRIGYRKVSARKYSMIDKLGNKAEAYTKAATREDRHEDDQDDVWQPLKYSDIHFMPNIGAIKSAQMNVNPPEVLSQKMDLNVMPVERPKLGIQLDKEHSADDAELSMPTQIITACANKGYTLTKTDEMYRAISTLTELAIEDCMKGIMDLVPGGENRGLLKAQIAQIIVDKLIQSKDDNEALHAVLGFLEDKVKAGGKVSPEDVQNIPWSDTLIYNKLYSDIASHLTSQAIKLKLSGSMAVICPTHYLERFYGNKRLAALVDLIPGGIGEKLALLEYQRKIREENYEDGLIYDRTRDSEKSEIELLNQASKINTQHIYHLEYINPLTGEVDPNTKQITVNYPMQYYQLRDEIVKFRQASQEELKGALAVTRADGTIQVSKLEDIDPEAFYAYISGEARDAEGKVIVSSEQKRKVFEQLKNSGYTIDSLKKLLGNDPRKILAFLKFHELSHKKYKDNITTNTRRSTKQSPQTTQFTWNRTSDNSYEVSSKGDKRFSALYATFKKGTIIDGIDVGGMTIEDVYQKVVKKSGKGKAPSRDSRLFIDTTPKLRGKMSFAFGSQRADGVTADTTLEAIKRGERTATTRYTSDGNINYWKQAKVGDVIEFSGQNGEKVLVRVTKELHQLPKSTTAEEWSSKEGWDTSRFEQRVKPQIDKGEAYQMEFEYIDPSKEAMEDFSYREGYLPLWQEWARQNPELMEELRENAKGKTLTDRFANTRVSQARALADILNSQRVKEQKGDILSNAVIEMEARATKEAWDKMIEIEAGSINAQEYLQEISELNAVYEAVCKQEQKEDGTTETIPLGRELSAYNVRFSSPSAVIEGKYRPQREFCLYDLDSIKLLFEVINDTKPKKGYKLDEIKGYFKNQLTTLAGIQNYIQSNPLLQNNYAQIIKNMLKYIETKYNDEFNTFKDVHGNYTFLQTLTDGDPTVAFTDHPELLNKAIEAYKYAVKLFLRKQLQKDLISLSLDYKGKRNVMIGGKVYNIDGDSITPIAYELIMPKIYKTIFGLQENDDLQRISADKNFFTRRGISRLKNQIGDDSLYDYQLKRFTGDHMYIFDANHGPIPKGLITSPNFHLFTEQDGSYSRVDAEGNVIYPLSSKDDEVMMTADGVEVIVTKNPAFFIENNNSNAITFSNSRVNEERMQDIVNKLKNSTTNNGRRFIRTFTDRNGKIKNFSTLNKRNRMFADLNESILESNKSTGDADLDRLVAEISQEGLKVHASFLKSLDVIAGRIPAQSQQSFMTQKVAAFTNSDINSAYVSVFQLFIQGSDLDIDTVNLIGAGFDRQGHYVLWSPYANLGNSELIKASEQLPFPTGQATEITYDNSKDSFFITFNDFFGKNKLFNIELDPNTGDVVRNEQGVYKISFDSESPTAIKQLAEFLNLVEKVGLNLKGNVDQYGNHQYSEELDEEIYAQNLRYRDLGIFTDLHIKPSQLLNVLQQIKEIVDKHNLYIKKVDKRTKEIMAKNLSYCRMFEIAGDPSNQMEAQDSIDNSTKVIKGPEGAVKVTMTEEDKNQVSSNNETKSFPDPVSMVDSLQTNQVGKYDVSVAAKAVQACSMIQYAYDSLLNSDAPEEKKRRLELPNGGYKIAGKQWTAIANLHDKTHEETGEMQQPDFIKDMLKVLDDETVEKINSAIQNAAMLSVAVDNAKDLSLGKINAGPAMLGMYAYGITLGIDVVTLAKIINSPQGRAISKALSGNVFTGDMGFSSALQAINFLNGQNLTRFLTQFDYADNRGSKTLFNAFKNIATKELSRDQNDKCAQEIQEGTTKSITKVVEILLRKGKFDSYLNQIQKTSSWGYSEKQLFEALKEYKELIQLWNGDENKKHDLEILSQGAEEIRVLGVLLGSNKGVKTKIEDGINFINTLENIISDRYKIMHPDADESKIASLKIDYLRFCTDKEYMEWCIDEYDKVKHTVNILQVVALCPHIFSYLRTSIIPHAGFMSASSKYRSTQAVINSGIYNTLGIRAAKDKSNSLKGLNNEINAMMLMQWLSDTQKVFYLPRGQRYFKSGTNELVVYEGKDPLPISLWTPEGLATFKLYMEQCILPELKNSAFEDNKFVKNLSPFTLSQTGTRATVSAYTLTGNLLPKAGTAEEALLREYQAAFETIKNISFPYKEYKKDTSEGSTIGTYGDALYLYSEYVFGGRKGPNSLMALFEQGNNELQKQFRKAKADMDKNRDFKLTIMQKLRSMALMSNIFNPKYSYYYAVNNTDIGVNFYKNEEKTLTAKEKDARAKEAAELGENYGSIISKRAMYEKEGYENGEEQVQNFLYPELTTPSSQEISLGDVQVTFKDGKITDWNINPKVAQDTFKISGDNDSEIIENFNNSDKEEIKNTIAEIDNIVKMINDNIDMTYTGVYVDGTVVTEIRNLDIVQTALELAVLKGTGKC